MKYDTQQQQKHIAYANFSFYRVNLSIWYKMTKKIFLYASETENQLNFDTL